jgi:small subunit ribosomal protein S17
MTTRGNRRRLEGVVTSNAMDKSVVVVVKRLVKHPLYKKYIRQRTKVMAHDEENACHVGDRVELIETRPISKSKSWRVLRVFGEVKGGIRREEVIEEEVAEEIGPHKHEEEAEEQDEKDTEAAADAATEENA